MRDLSQILEKLWDAYGKQHNERQIRVYYEWARTKEMSTLNKIVDIWIGSEKFFPSLSDLKLLYQKQTKSTSIDDYEECYFCGSSGFIPTIVEKEDKKHMVNYKCKCSNATMSGIPAYFDVFSELEYKEFARANRGLNYPQCVDLYFKELLFGSKERLIDF